MLNRSKPLRRSSWQRRNPRKRKNPRANGWTKRVFFLYGQKCYCGKRATQAHHVVPRQRIMADVRLTQEEREALEYDARNGLPICDGCHAAHELAAGHKESRRIPHGALRPQNLAWALAWGFAYVVNDRNVYPRKAAF